MDTLFWRGFICLFIYLKLFKDVTNTGYIALNDRVTMKDEVGGVWKEVVVSWIGALSLDLLRCPAEYHHKTQDGVPA